MRGKLFLDLLDMISGQLSTADFTGFYGGFYGEFYNGFYGEFYGEFYDEFYGEFDGEFYDDFEQPTDILFVCLPKFDELEIPNRICT